MKIFKHVYANFVENWKPGLLSIEDGDLEQVWLSSDSTETYRIESLPFFSYDYSYLDEVEAEYRMIGEERILFVDNLVKASNYTTFRVRILNEEITEYILSCLSEAQLETEKSSPHMYAIAALPEQVESIKEFLDNGFKLGYIEWEIGKIVE